MTAFLEARLTRLRDRSVPWAGALRRVPRAMWDDNVSDWAAALTYYAVLALVPALVVTASVIGLWPPT